MTAKTLLKRYNKGERVFAGEPFEFADLRGAKLCGADFSGSDFSNANLCGANLENCILTDAKLNHTNLGGSNLKRVVDAQRADFLPQILGGRVWMMPFLMGRYSLERVSATSISAKQV